MVSRVLVLVLLVSSTVIAGGESRPKSIYDFTVKSIDGKDVRLSQYKGRVLLLVNVASRCGYTPQYKDLEALYRRYKDQGFVVLGFPANNFGEQEPGSDAEIKKFCTTSYGVTFPMFSKISVAGDDQHPLYRFITSPPEAEPTSGRKETDPDFSGEVKWNFQKYLVSRDGKIIGKYLSRVKPMDKEMTTAIETALGPTGE